MCEIIMCVQLHNTGVLKQQWYRSSYTQLIVYTAPTTVYALKCHFITPWQQPNFSHPLKTNCRLSLDDVQISLIVLIINDLGRRGGSLKTRVRLKRPAFCTKGFQFLCSALHDSLPATDCTD